jgi:hypothetical protein
MHPQVAETPYRSAMDAEPDPRGRLRALAAHLFVCARRKADRFLAGGIGAASPELSACSSASAGVSTRRRLGRLALPGARTVMFAPGNCYLIATSKLLMKDETRAVARVPSNRGARI